MDFFTISFNCRPYSYNRDGVDVIRWSLDGLVIDPGMSVCEINGTPYKGGDTVPWKDIKPGGGKISCHGSLVTTFYLKKVENEEDWTSFVGNNKFPEQEKLPAYRAFFATKYLEGKRNGSLSPEFFNKILKFYSDNAGGVQTIDALAQEGYWNIRRYSFLAAKLIDGDENTPKTYIPTIKEMEI